MKERTFAYDPADSLTTPEAVAYFINDALETADAGYISQALGIAARAKGMTRVSKETGLAREALYRSFSDEGNPSLKSTLAVLKSLGFQLSIRPIGQLATAEEAAE
jgi:probable addiction module antidote protein